MLQRLSEWKPLFLALTVLLLVGLFVSRVLQPDAPPSVDEPSVTVRAAEAEAHVGETAEVCGTVTDVSYVPRISGAPTFVNLGEAYPAQAFTAVIWGAQRHHWGNTPPEQRYRGQSICVRGPIEMHEGTPQIEVRHPQQIDVRSRRF